LDDQLPTWTCAPATRGVMPSGRPCSAGYTFDVIGLIVSVQFGPGTVHVMDPLLGTFSVVGLMKLKPEPVQLIL
jgi:hypothetical protein